MEGSLWIGCVIQEDSNVAHFTDMLFMGSTEYPEEGEFHRYHALLRPAWTSGDHTLYYFNVLPHGLPWWIGSTVVHHRQIPIFPVNLVLRSIGLGKGTGSSQFGIRYGSNARPSTFMVCSNKTLCVQPTIHFHIFDVEILQLSVQDDIRNWFEAEYDPRGMHLVIYGHKPIVELEILVKARFGKIPFSEQWKGPVRAESSGIIVPLGHGYSLNQSRIFAN